MKKEEIRKLVWDRMLRDGIARFPLPPHGRIPNFVGAEEAAKRLAKLEPFAKAKVLKINPDSPQRPVRHWALTSGKKVVMPTPRIRRGFLLLDPEKIPRSALSYASTIKGAFRYGSLVKPWNLPKIDAAVVGSVAVDTEGRRIGKGEGYSEIEFGVLVEVGVLEREAPIATTVHDVQVLPPPLPTDPWDVSVDYVVTPTKVIRAVNRPPRPKGILWELIPEKKVEEIPVLSELRRMLRR